MKKIILLLSLSFLAMPVLAATAQQEKMKTCNAKAKGLKGDEFKKVRDECLKAQPAAAAAGTEAKQLTPQQEKMKTCNAKAKGLKGAEFKKVRDACLKA
ncbi:MAG: phosphate starvation-inducible protein PsiF [Betaproteobacteria bacterium]|nr:phosphate starvation-inducible protein PsiF [Betaproteobacteria bacterium]